MTTVRDIVTDAHIEIGVLDPTESLSAQQGAYGLRVLNRMVEKMNTDALMVYTLNRQLLVNFTPGKQTYTLGTGGDINVPRPVRIDMASILLSTGVELPLHLYTDEEWRDVSVKNTSGSFPTGVWIQGNMPLNSLSFWPIPTDGTSQLVLYTWGQTSDFASLNDTVVFPNGYEEFLVTNLAVALSNSYGTQPALSLQNRAADSRSKIESLNVEPIAMSFDFTGGRGGMAVRSFGLVVDR